MLKLNQIFKTILAASTFIVSTGIWAESATTTVTASKVDASKPSYTYTEDTPNFIVSANHPEFILKLKANPTTGFSWFLREYDNDILMPIKHVYQKPIGKLIGAPGYDLWTFKVKPAGFVVPQQTMMRMVYARPWSPDSSTQVVFRISTN